MKSALLTATGLVLSTAVLAAGCGGSDMARVSLTDDACTYEGDATFAPGPIEIEVENKTAHFAIISMSALVAGKTTEDVRLAGERGRPSSEVVTRLAGEVSNHPHETNVMTGYENSSRLVIVCWLHHSADAPQSHILPPPKAFYVVPDELVVG